MGDLIGGEAPLSPSKLRSRFLRAHGRAAAARCVKRCYERWPELDRRYGERGRQHAARDAAWHLEFLDESIAAGEPILFDNYADWLSGLLAARGIGPEQVAGAFGFLAEEFEAVECPASLEDDRGAVVALLRSNRARFLGPAARDDADASCAAQPGGPAAPVVASALTGIPPHLAYFDRLMKLDRQGAFAVADAYLDEHGDVLGLYVDVLEPALVHSGTEWQCGQITVAHEHYISEATRDVIRRYGPRAFPEASPGGPVAVACCAPRERHSLGLMMVADALRAGGLEVHMLGESLPAEVAVGFVAQVEADLLCLSCTLPAHLSGASRLIKLARRSRPGLKIALGGSAIRQLEAGAPGRLGADWTASDARDVRRSLPAWRQSMTARSEPRAGPADARPSPPAP